MAKRPKSQAKPEAAPDKVRPSLTGVERSDLLRRMEGVSEGSDEDAEVP